MTSPANMALRRPNPPIGLGQALAETGSVSAMMDLSDGLRQDLARLCAASRVGAVISPEKLPPHPDVSGAADALSMMTAFGEEYELLFIAQVGSAKLIQQAAAPFGSHPVCIGVVTDRADDGARLEGVEWPEPRFTHFGEA